MGALRAQPLDVVVDAIAHGERDVRRRLVGRVTVRHVVVHIDSVGLVFRHPTIDEMDVVGVVPLDYDSMTADDAACMVLHEFAFAERAGGYRDVGAIVDEESMLPGVGDNDTRDRNDGAVFTAIDAVFRKAMKPTVVNVDVCRRVANSNRSFACRGVRRVDAIDQDLVAIAIDIDAVFRIVIVSSIENRARVSALQTDAIKTIVEAVAIAKGQVGDLAGANCITVDSDAAAGIVAKCARRKRDVIGRTTLDVDAISEAYILLRILKCARREIACCAVRQIHA